jgi:hypothetical protein
MLVSAHLQVANILITIHVSNCRLVTWPHYKDLWECGTGGKFSVIVRRETGGIATVFYCDLASEKFKRHFLIPMSPRAA